MSGRHVRVTTFNYATREYDELAAGEGLSVRVELAGVTVDVAAMIGMGTNGAARISVNAVGQDFINELETIEVATNFSQDRLIVRGVAGRR